MRQSPSIYEKAVQHFDDVVDAPITKLCAKPADLTHALNRSSSTNFRAVAEAEANGLLRRDLKNHYARGALARRIGFSAFGIGQLSDVVEPLLIDLRERTRRTSVIIVQKGDQVFVGPFSLGRGPEYVRPEQTYFTRLIRADEIRVQCSLESLRKGSRSPSLRAVSLQTWGDCTAALGVLAFEDFEGTAPDTFSEIELIREHLLMGRSVERSPA